MVCCTDDSDEYDRKAGDVTAAPISMGIACISLAR